MQPSLYKYLQGRNDLLHFIRQNPQWYRRLTRNPDQLEALEREAKVFYGKTVPQRIEKVSSQIQMVSMLMQMAGAMKD
ncbi:YlbE-like family protein [Aquibacillus koreensis]|uniref:YlbE-like family protein n=1 Tax=Aquibacillus koreensis TaxID=279446 RepID=A0A9X3WLV4_9BACI|nr:YlbE-like family protein [Aquibacillus koreensis]MCT2538083.1 YlbE-like family protein [Aquibacillus koreensis]MDC3420606.1 YlbE-like family protein [Aquibacillus koreensis]